MNDDTLKKLGIAALVLFLCVPMMPKILNTLSPKPLTFTRVEEALRARGMSVDQVTKIEPPQLESVAQVGMYVNGANVALYKYDSEGKIVKQLEYQKPDSGTVAVEAMGIAQSLGARVRHQMPLTATRNGMMMLVVASDDKGLNLQIAKIFEGL